jgi:FMN reductase
VVHALRGWPTPLGVGVNTTEASIPAGGPCNVPSVHAQLRLVGEQVVRFARRGVPA